MTTNLVFENTHIRYTVKWYWVRDTADIACWPFAHEPHNIIHVITTRRLSNHLVFFHYFMRRHWLQKYKRKNNYYSLYYNIIIYISDLLVVNKNRGRGGGKCKNSKLRLFILCTPTLFYRVIFNIILFYIIYPYTISKKFWMNKRSLVRKLCWSHNV